MNDTAQKKDTAPKTNRGRFIEYLKDYSPAAAEKDKIYLPQFSMKRAIEAAATLNIPYSDAINNILLLVPYAFDDPIIINAYSFEHCENFHEDDYPNKGDKIELVKAAFLNDYISNLNAQSSLNEKPSDIKTLFKNFNQAYEQLRKMWMVDQYGIFTQAGTLSGSVQRNHMGFHTIGYGTAIVSLKTLFDTFSHTMYGAFNRGRYSKYSPNFPHNLDNDVAAKAFDRYYEENMAVMIEHCESEMVTCMKNNIDIIRRRVDFDIKKGKLHNFGKFMEFIRLAADFRSVFPIHIDTGSEKIEEVKKEFFELTRECVNRTFGHSINVVESLTSLSLLDPNMLQNTPELKKFLGPIRVKQMFGKELHDEMYAFLFEQAFNNLEDNPFNGKDISERELLMDMLEHECNVYVKAAIIHAMHGEFEIPTALDVRDLGLINKSESKALIQFYRNSSYTIINSKTIELLSGQASYLCGRLVERVQEKIEIKLQDFEIDAKFLSELAYMLTIVHVSATHSTIDGIVRTKDIICRNAMAEQNRELIKTALQ